MILAPSPKGSTLTAYVGETTQIDLQVGGRIEEPMKILIRKKPRIGTLSDPIHISRNLVRVFYSVPPNSPQGDDSFSYAVQSRDSPVSTAAKVKITIRLRPANLHFPSSLDFGNVPTGDSLEKDVIVENSGGMTAELYPKLNSPWAVLDPLPIKVHGGKSQKFRIGFSPVNAGFFAESLVLNDAPDRHLALRGSSEPPLEWPHDGILFESRKRIDSLSLATFTNVTDQPRTIDFEWPDFLKAPSSVTVDPHSSKEISVSLKADPSFNFRGSVDFSCGHFKSSLPIVVQSAPPIIKLEPSSILNLGEISTGSSAKGQLALTNSGGQSATVSIEIPKEIQVEPSPTQILLPPGTTIRFDVTVTPQKTGTIDYLLPVHSQTDALGAFGIRVSSREPLRKKTEGPSPRPIDKTPTKPASSISATPDLVDSPPESDITSYESSPYSVTISWKITDSKTKSFIVERREIKSESDDNVNVEWVKWTPPPSIEISGDTATAHFRKLEPNSFWHIRLRGLDAQGIAAPPSQGHFRIETKPVNLFTIPFWIWAPLLIAALAFGYHFIKKHFRLGSHDLDERIAKLEK